jgi:hypothetical protein
MWSNVVQCGSRVRRKLGELLVEKELTCMPAGVVSLGTQLCADNKGASEEGSGWTNDLGPCRS